MRNRSLYKIFFELILKSFSVLWSRSRSELTFFNGAGWSRCFLTESEPKFEDGSAFLKEGKTNFKKYLKLANLKQICNHFFFSFSIFDKSRLNKITSSYFLVLVFRCSALNCQLHKTYFLLLLGRAPEVRLW